MRDYEIQNLVEGVPVAVVTLGVCWVCAEVVVRMVRRSQGHPKAFVQPTGVYLLLGLAAGVFGPGFVSSNAGPAQIALSFVILWSYPASLPYIVARIFGQQPREARTPLWVQFGIVLLAFAVPIGIMAATLIINDWLCAMEWVALADWIMGANFVLMPPALLVVFLRVLRKRVEGKTA